MALDTIAETLTALDLFRGLDPEQLARLAREAERLLIKAGQPLLSAGADGEGALIVVAGSAKALPDPEISFPGEDVGPGTMLGETALLVEHRHRLTVVAETDVRAIRIRRDTLFERMQADPSLAAHFQARLAARLSRLALELRLIDERLAAVCEPPQHAAEPLAATG